uniref:AAA+ ATPase domain-containing protein n=1 Tax=viral metagenome TaxID=1070528 RepID=A0A6C0CT69_9ZZZZ
MYSLFIHLTLFYSCHSFFIFNYKDNSKFYDTFHTNEKTQLISKKSSRSNVTYFPSILDVFMSQMQPMPSQPPSSIDIENVRQQYQKKKPKRVKSDNFEVIQHDLNFTHVGGYDTVKKEMMQIADMLLNFEKYQKFNVRTPKGLMLEGSPGNGKTLLAKAFSGELNISFIPTSGSHFQEKYVGVGAARIRELFELAKENKPCIVFIDEIDSIGRKRTDDDSSSSGEHGSSLNELLNCMDGFKSTNGVFVIGATNRIDLLDKALIRPGRIDKMIHLGMPDEYTREAVLRIHIKDKPCDPTIKIDDLIEQTQGLSCAQIENLLNEAMLHALLMNREIVQQSDIDIILNRVLVGHTPTPFVYSKETLYRIAIHELGHALVGHLLPKYTSFKKVIMDVHSPTTPGFTLFDTDKSDIILTRDQLMDHLSVLLAGCIAEDIFLNNTSSGASNDILKCKHIIESMVFDYGMNTRNVVVPQLSEKSKEHIDDDINEIMNEAYHRSLCIILDNISVVHECVNILLIDRVLTRTTLEKVIRVKHEKHVVKTNVT